MAQFFSATGTSTGTQFLHVPAPPPRKPSRRRASTTRNEFDDLLSSDADRDLEISFASTMSLHSPPQDLCALAPETHDASYTPMDISPAPPPRREPVVRPMTGRPRAFTSAARLFGRDMSNQHSNDSVVSDASVARSGTGTTGSGSGKRLQRSALPLEWMAPAGPNQNDLAAQNIPASPDAMDIDTSFVYVPARTVHNPQSAAPTITQFNLDFNHPLSAPVSATPTVGTFNLFFGNSPPRAASPAPTELSHEVSQVSESPVQPFTKKRRSSSPDAHSLRRGYDHLLHEEPSFDSSPAASSPSQHKLERLVSAQFPRKPMLLGLGAPLALNANKKRPRRPALSAMVPPGEGPGEKARSANPVPTSRAGDKENAVGAMRPPALPPVRRAFSAMLPPNMLEPSMSSEDGSFGEDADMSSPAQAYARRQQVKTIRRCDGTDDFRPVAGATALVRRDSDVIGRGLRRSEDREDRERERVERDTPRSKYLGAGSGLGGFGDNEALGKILPCHRVREDGLMRITCKTLDNLLDGVYDSKLASFLIIDCRFDYEYNGGHIPGAMNINTTAGVEEYLLGQNAVKPVASTSGDAAGKTVLIFHCEFSVKRAPTFAKHLRSKDRALNNHVYPKIHFPEVYVLEGGYSQYFSASGARCQPAGYVTMDDPCYAASRKEDLDQFRKAKFGRTKSYAYGEGKIASFASREPKRNTAPSGTNTLFAAANAARTRRGAVQMLPEDNAHQSEDEDTDIGDSPCPPPTKGAVYKGKKIGRLAKAETYGPSHMMVGY